MSTSAVRLTEAEMPVGSDPAAPSFKEQSGQLEAEIRKYCPKVDNLVYAHHYTYDVKCNWKVLVYNFCEFYHCAAAHRDFVDLVDMKSYRTRARGIYSSQISGAARSTENSAYKFKEAVVDFGYAGWYVWPNLTILCYPGETNLSALQMIPNGPENAIEHFNWFLPSTQPSPQIKDAMAYTDQTLQPEDIRLCESVQRGLKSNGFKFSTNGTRGIGCRSTLRWARSPRVSPRSQKGESSMSNVSSFAGIDCFETDPRRSRTLPGRYYWEPEIFEQERRRIFQRSWQYVGHVSMLPEPGSYVVREILDQSVVLLRDRVGELRAFFNVCQHRAHRLLEGEGRLSAIITCPYHAWAYDLSGSLRSARGTEGLEDFNKKAFSLAPVRLDSFLGFLFVNLDGQALPFGHVAGALAAEVASFSPAAANLACAYRQEYELKANWKNSVENYSECFHCPISHRSLVEGALDYGSYRITVHEHHHSHRSRDKDAARGYKAKTETAAKTDEFGSWLLWPNWCLEVYPGGNLTVFHHVPVTPELTVQKVEWYFPPHPLTGEERSVIDFVHGVRLEDIPICESVQSGLHSLGYRRGRFVVDSGRTEISEHAVHDFQVKILRALSAAV